MSYYLCLFVVVVVVCLLVCPQYMAYKWLGRLLWPFCALARGLSVVNNAYFIALLDKNACTDLCCCTTVHIEYRYTMCSTTHILLWFHIFLSYSSILNIHFNYINLNKIPRYTEKVKQFPKFSHLPYCFENNNLSYLIHTTEI